MSKSLDGIITSWNTGAERIFGYSAADMIGTSILRIIPPELHPEERQVLARLRRGERIDHYETVRVARDGRRVDISLTVSPIRDGSGTVVGASKVARDVTERKQSEKAQLLLMGELSHRVKNTLATVQAIATQSLRRSRDPAEFVPAFTGRIHALARAHDLLSETRWEGIELGALVRDQGAARRARPPHQRARAGPDARAAAGAASRHGAARARHQCAQVRCAQRAARAPDYRLARRRQQQGPRAELNWTEAGGPPVVAPARRGFGTRLIEESLLAHNGEARITYAADGLTCDLTLPAARPAGAAGTLPGAGGAVQPAGHGGPRAAARQAHHGRGRTSPLIAMEIEATLRDGGCAIIGPVGDPAEAMKLLADGCDAALLDANLGGKPVDALAAALTRADIPFAFITGYGADGVPQAFRETMIVAKPFSKDQLLASLARLMQHRSDPEVYQLGNALRAKL
ncbi:MAG: HWE histidine kinase domain-containing protein [Bauldia sp.]